MYKAPYPVINQDKATDPLPHTNTRHCFYGCLRPEAGWCNSSPSPTINHYNGRLGPTEPHRACVRFPLPIDFIIVCCVRQKRDFTGTMPIFNNILTLREPFSRLQKSTCADSSCREMHPVLYSKNNVNMTPQFFCVNTIHFKLLHLC